MLLNFYCNLLKININFFNVIYVFFLCFFFQLFTAHHTLGCNNPTDKSNTPSSPQPHPSPPTTAACPHTTNNPPHVHKLLWCNLDARCKHQRHTLPDQPVHRRLILGEAILRQVNGAIRHKKEVIYKTSINGLTYDLAVMMSKKNNNWTKLKKIGCFQKIINISIFLLF